jgi:hypothetical protein
LVAVGVPLITPVLLLRPNPGGKLPDMMDQLYGVVPPVACRVRLYPAPTVPETNGLVVVIVGGRAPCWVTVKVCPATVNVPVLSEVLELDSTE